MLKGTSWPGGSFFGEAANTIHDEAFSRKREGRVAHLEPVGLISCKKIKDAVMKTAAAFVSGRSGISRVQEEYSTEKHQNH